MLSPALQSILKPAKTTMSLIWFALLVSAVIYPLLAYLIRQKGWITVQFDLEPSLIMIAAVFAAVAGVASLLAGGWVFKPATVQQIYKAKPSLKELARHPHTKAPDEQLLEQLKSLDYNEAFLFYLKTLYMNAMMARWVAAEFIAIIGLTLGLITADFRQAAYFVGPAALLMLLATPRLEGALDRARNWLD